MTDSKMYGLAMTDIGFRYKKCIRLSEKTVGKVAKRRRFCFDIRTLC